VLLVLVAVSCIPWMLCVKPFYLCYAHKRATKVKVSMWLPVGSYSFVEACRDFETGNNPLYFPRTAVASLTIIIIFVKVDPVIVLTATWLIDTVRMVN